jgi:hypothetical protein
MKFKALVLRVVGVGISLTASASRADNVYLGQVDLQQSSNYSSGSGGEFNATLYYDNSVALPGPVLAQSAPVQQPSINPNSPPAGLDAAHMANPALFQTFCIEEGPVNDVTFSPGTYYAATINPSTVNSHGTTLTVSPLTAALFALFWNDALTNYDYTPGSGRSYSAAELQTAIWVVQGDDSIAGAEAEAGLPNNDPLALYNDFITQATAFEGAPITSAVQILGLYDSSADAVTGGTGGLHQAQLVESSTVGTSAPLPAPVAGILAIVGIMGLSNLLRRARCIA